VVFGIYERTLKYGRTTMELKEYFEILMKRLKLIIVITLISTIASGLISVFLIDPTYKADISVIISQEKAESAPSTQTYNDIMMYQKMVKTYAEFAKSRMVGDRVIESLQLDMSVTALQGMLTVTPKGDTEFLTLSVKSKDPKLAQDIANQYARSLKFVSKEVKKVDNVQLLDEALLPTGKDSPRVSLNVAIAFFLGLMVSIGLVFLLEYLDNTVKTKEDIEKLSDIPVIGLLPFDEVLAEGKIQGILTTYSNPKSNAAEAYRTLRTNIQFSSLDKDIKTLVVTSTKPGEGKSTIISNMAITMAQSGKKVLLLDCDLRKPSIHKKFTLSNSKGLTNVLLKDKKFEDCINATDVDNLHVVTSGPVPPNPSELLGSNKFKLLLKHLSTIYDVVLIDTPPVLIVTDSQILSSICDGTVILTCHGETEKEALIEGKSLLQKVNSNILGVVLNKVPEGGKGYYYGKYYGRKSTRRKLYGSKNDYSYGYSYQETDGQTEAL
jgi:polysaccharide biosynthesis transport protein